MDFIILLMFIILLAFYSIPYKMDAWNKAKGYLLDIILLLTLIIVASIVFLLSAFCAGVILLCHLPEIVKNKGELWK